MLIKTCDLADDASKESAPGTTTTRDSSTGKSQDSDPRPGQDSSQLMTPLEGIVKPTFFPFLLVTIPSSPPNHMLNIHPDIKSETDLLPPGAEPGTMPTDLDQSTGLERLEILGKMQGIDVFDMRPLDSSRTGTLNDPILVKSAGNEQYAGCTGSPADSHRIFWLGMNRARPMVRCKECGSVYLMEYVGPEHDDHGDHGHGHEDHYDGSYARVPDYDYGHKDPLSEFPDSFLLFAFFVFCVDYRREGGEETMR